MAVEAHPVVVVALEGAAVVEAVVAVVATVAAEAEDMAVAAVHTAEEAAMMVEADTMNVSFRGLFAVLLSFLWCCSCWWR